MVHKQVSNLKLNRLTNTKKNDNIVWLNAGMAELADAQASGACGGNIVWVQVPFPALFLCKKIDIENFT